MSEGPVLEGIHRMLEASSPKVRELGEKALADMKEADILVALLDPRLSLAALLHFGLLSSQRGRPDWAQALSENPSYPPGGRDLLDRVIGGQEHPPVERAEGKASEEGAAEKGAADGEGLEEAEGPQPPGNEEPSEAVSGEDGEEKLSTYQRIMKMAAGEKIKLASKGNKEARGILIKDSNREVYYAVLENPGMTEAEIEVIARNTGTNQDILRSISKNKDWMANSAIVRAMVTNPKTPVEVANRYLGRLTDKELEMMDKSKSINSTLRNNAKRLLLDRKRKRG